MRKVNAAAVLGSSDRTVLDFFDTAGAPVDLDLLGATAVRFEINSGCYSSTIDAESFTGNTATVQFGAFAVPPSRSGQRYSVKIYYVSPTSPNGATLAAAGFETELLLRLVE